MDFAAFYSQTGKNKKFPLLAASSVQPSRHMKNYVSDIIIIIIIIFVTRKKEKERKFFQLESSKEVERKKGVRLRILNFCSL